MTEHLTSAKNPRVLAWRSLNERKGRLAHEAFLVEGDRMVAEALSSAYPVEALLFRTDRYREQEEGIHPMNLPPEVPVYVLADHVFADLLKFVIASVIVNHIAGFGIQTDLFSDCLKQRRTMF